MRAPKAAAQRLRPRARRGGFRKVHDPGSIGALGGFPIALPGIGRGSSRARLTRRQEQCLKGRQAHFTAKEIARLLGISHHTVAMHWRNARRRLDALAAARRANAEAEAPEPSEGPQFGASDIWVARVAMAGLFLGAFATLLYALGLFTLYAAGRMGWPPLQALAAGS